MSLPISIPAASGCTTSKLRSSVCIFRIISRRCWRFISPHLLGFGLTVAFCLLFLPFWDFCHGSLFTLLLLLLNSTWLGPGGETYTISPAGSGLVPYPGQA